ncbi:MAG: heat-inducible transcriptional repressor HrcA [Clostridia bacterium]|nr:heat-inducible transcriptional repressor HrcA [Clostridia bacterium]MDD4275709.1 heat-inducible transcriptional repressor HrcA [Clostridia bacterium]
MIEELSKRKQEILCGAIEDYIKCAVPITSGGIQKKFLQSISTATLRNELSTLESMGYLKQVHTSGGRIPTEKAYRYFVNSIMPKSSFNKETLADIKSVFNNRTAYLSEIIRDIAKVVSRATNYPTVVMVSGFDKLLINSIKIIPLINGSALVLIETNTGIINNTIELKSPVTEQNCIDASYYLTRKFISKTILDLINNINNYEDAMEREIKHYQIIFNNLLNSLLKYADSVDSRAIFSEGGASKLLSNPEYNDIDKAKHLLEFLEDKTAIENMLNTESDQEISYVIGSEIDNQEFAGCSLVKANYLMGNEQIASIGVIGPQRMDYGLAAAALKFVVDELKKMDKKTTGK